MREGGSQGQRMEVSKREKGCEGASEAVIEREQR